MENILIVGGSSGLGLEIAKSKLTKGDSVTITGRKDPEVAGLRFINFDIKGSIEELIPEIDNILDVIENLDVFVYAAGFNQEGHIDDFSDNQILDVINVGVSVPAFFANRIKKSYKKAVEFVFITSSSQFTAREMEPLYTTSKAAMGMFGNSLSMDSQIGKVTVVAVSGMKTAFWRNMDRDISSFLDPEWVAKQVEDTVFMDYKYMFIKILRNPNVVEFVERR